MRLEEPSIDLAILTRNENPISEDVLDSVRSQRGIRLNLHRIVGTPQPEDPNRIATIARARNSAIRLASSPWLMFLDDDVAVAPDCIARLHHALASRPDYAALAADYLGESRPHLTAPHVAMGATMFRKSVLQKNQFRWEPMKCECLCCCEDLRKTGSRVEYLPGAKAWHLERSKQALSCNVDSIPQDAKESAELKSAAYRVVQNAESHRTKARTTDGKVLVAFNRRDVRRFRDVFLRSLRQSGNQCDVIVVGYGLQPSEVHLLSQRPGVTVIAKRFDGRMPPLRRLEDFAEITASLDDGTPVAYWDAGDVVIQSSLAPLWELAKQSPQRILGVREPLGFPYNAAVVGWTRTIKAPENRRRTFELFASRPFLNSGFSAGTAAAMNHYFNRAVQLRGSDDLKGTTDWGDQTAFNLYCHTNEDRWLEVPEGWNYCVHDRPTGEVHVTPDGRVTCQSGTPIHVVHGNARSLRKMAYVR